MLVRHPPRTPVVMVPDNVAADVRASTAREAMFRRLDGDATAPRAAVYPVRWHVVELAPKEAKGRKPRKRKPGPPKGWLFG